MIQPMPSVRPEPSPAQDSEAVMEALPAGPTDDVEGTRSFMDRLSQADREALRSRAHNDQCASGAVICREGDPGDAVYVIESGQVAVLKETSGGHFTLLARWGPGAILGEMSLVGQQSRSASLVATQSTELLRIDATEFQALMDAHPGISWAVLSALNDRLQAADMARTTILQQERDMERRLERLTTETERLGETVEARQETIELIVHDLRTPLAVIEGSLQLLHAQLSEEALRSLGQVLILAERSSQRLASLLEELLSAARREDADLSLTRRAIHLPHLVQDAADAVRTLAEQAQVELALELPQDLPTPKGDPVQLERVMVNLLDNAISYTPQGGRVVIDAVRRPAEVEISVTDTGPGIPPEHREVIFERFTRLPGVEGRRRGFGLGLYFCSRVVAAHGGRIWVEPSPEKMGSRFVFTLPLGTEG